MSLGWGDGRLEGDMGFEPDGLPSPHPSNQPPAEKFVQEHAPIAGSRSQLRVGLRPKLLRRWMTRFAGQPPSCALAFGQSFCVVG